MTGEVVLAQAVIGRSWNRKAEVSSSLSILSQVFYRPSPHGPVLASLQQSDPGYVDCAVAVGDLKRVHFRSWWKWHGIF